MTIEEAIEIINKTDFYSCFTSEKQDKAFNMALYALSTYAGIKEDLQQLEDSGDSVAMQISSAYRKIITEIEKIGVNEEEENPSTCGDAISRQEVLEIINFEEKWLLDANSHNEDTKIAFSAIKSKISELTSLNPSRKTDDGGMK